MAGFRQSEWATQNRCQKVLVRLMRGPASLADLVEIMHSVIEGNNEKVSEDIMRKRLENDLKRLRDAYGCIIHYNRASAHYHLEALDYDIIDFPDEMIETLSFLLTTFNRQTAPMGSQVSAFLQQLITYLPSQRQKQMIQKRSVLELDLEARDDDEITADVWTALRQSCGHRLLEFDYRAASRNEDEKRTHRVEPLRYYFDPRKGHTYLEAFWLESRGTIIWKANRLGWFRVGRISNPIVLPQKFTPGTRKFKTWDIEYILSPDISRQGATTHIANSQKLPQPDGSMRIRAVSTNLFMDIRHLLHYGAGCRIVGGEDAIAEIKKITSQMRDLYKI